MSTNNRSNTDGIELQNLGEPRNNIDPDTTSTSTNSPNQSSSFDNMVNYLLVNINRLTDNINNNPKYKRYLIFSSAFLLLTLFIIIISLVYIPSINNTIYLNIILFFLIIISIFGCLTLVIKYFESISNNRLSPSMFSFLFVSIFAFILIGFSLYLSKAYVFPQLSGILFAFYLFFLIFIYISILIIIVTKGLEMYNNESFPLKKYFINWFIVFLSGFGIIALIFGIIFLFGFFSSHLLILKLLIIIVAILILAYLVKKIVILQKINNLFINILLYIPCLVTDILDISIGDKSYLFLILLEILLIIIYLYYPKIQSSLYTKNASQLINKPLKLYEFNSLGTSQQLNKSDDPQYNYAISFWIYLDSVSPSINNSYTKEGTILSLGKTPIVRYKSIANQVIIYAEANNQDINIERIIGKINDIKLQKWNHIVINYSGGTMDIFYNGKLISSTPEVVPFQKFEVLEVGEKNGTSGGIANLLYFRKSIDIFTIRYLYNSFKDKNPPILKYPDLTIIPQN